MDPQYAQWLPPGWDPTEFSAAQATQAIALVGASMDEVLELAAMTSLLHPALDDVLCRGDDRIQGEVARVLDWLFDDDEDDEGALDLPTLAAAVRPWQLLLQLADSDGIPLTSAGWMRPAYVQSIYEDLGMEHEWVGKGNREDMTLPVFLLRQSPQHLGLLRKRKAALVLTPAGRAAVNDVDALWEHLTASALPTKPGFVRDASALWLAAASTTGELDAIPGDRVASWLSGLGWRTADGAGVEATHLDEATREVAYVLAQVCGRSRRRSGPGRRDGDARLVQAFAGAALMHNDE